MSGWSGRPWRWVGSGRRGQMHRVVPGRRREGRWVGDVQPSSSDGTQPKPRVLSPPITPDTEHPGGRGLRGGGGRRTPSDTTWTYLQASGCSSGFATARRAVMGRSRTSSKPSFVNQDRIAFHSLRNPQLTLSPPMSSGDSLRITSVFPGTFNTPAPDVPRLINTKSAFIERQADPSPRVATSRSSRT